MFESNKFYLLLRCQYSLLKSLYFRFYSFSDLLIQNFNFLQDRFTYKFKFQLIFNLRRIFETSILGSFFFKKKFGRIVFSKFNCVYEMFLLGLWRSVLFPIFELSSDRFLLDYRPFRLSQDSFFFIKKNLLNKKKYLFFSKSLFSLCPLVEKLLVRSCLIPRIVLKSWINFCKLEQNKNGIFDFSFFRDSGNVYFNFFNFLINGLVCF